MPYAAIVFYITPPNATKDQWDVGTIAGWLTFSERGQWTGFARMNYGSGLPLGTGASILSQEQLTQFAQSYWTAVYGEPFQFLKVDIPAFSIIRNQQAAYFQVSPRLRSVQFNPFGSASIFIDPEKRQTLGDLVQPAP